MSNFPPLQAGVPIVDATGAPTANFLLYMQQLSSGVANSSGASMPTPPPVEIDADYSGNIVDGQLPKTVRVQRLLNGDDVSTRTRWFLTTLSGDITATIDQTGIITITAIGSDSVLQVQSNRDKVTLTCNVSVDIAIGGTPISGSSGTNSTSSFSSVSSNIDTPITDEITVTVGSSGSVQLNAPLTVSTTDAAPTGDYPVLGKWQWWNGSAWVDVAAEIQSSPDCEVSKDDF